MLAQFFNEDIEEWSKAVVAEGMHLRRYAPSFPCPVEGRQVPVPGFPWTREWLTTAEVIMTSARGEVDENWLPGRLTGALNLGGEEVGKDKRYAPSTQGRNRQTVGAYL